MFFPVLMNSVFKKLKIIYVDINFLPVHNNNNLEWFFCILIFISKKRKCNINVVSNKMLNKTSLRYELKAQIKQNNKYFMIQTYFKWIRIRPISGSVPGSKFIQQWLTGEQEERRRGVKERLQQEQQQEQQVQLWWQGIKKLFLSLSIYIYIYWLTERRTRDRKESRSCFSKRSSSNNKYNFDDKV